MYEQILVEAGASAHREEVANRSGLFAVEKLPANSPYVYYSSCEYVFFHLANVGLVSHTVF